MITFNGRSFDEFGVYVDDSEAHAKPLRSFETVEVPGRNGELTYSNNRFENVDIELTCLIKKDFVRRYSEFMAFLQSVDGYQRLELGTEADFYRMAMLNDIGKMDIGQWAHFGKFEITFTAKPQRWLKSGETVKKNPTSLFNPTRFEARPLVRCYGSGVLKIGTETLTIADSDNGYMDVDCEMQDCYSGANNCNSLVTLSSGNFPTLPTGKTAMSFTGDRFEIIPRWWTI